MLALAAFHAMHTNQMCAFWLLAAEALFVIPRISCMRGRVGLSCCENGSCRKCVATKWLQKLQRCLIWAELRGIYGRIAYYQCGFSREIKAVKSSGNDGPWLTSARKPFIFKGLRACYICHSVFATLLQHAFPKKCFATDGIVPGGFGVSAVFEAFIMAYY